jgi:preprotein translocase subunit SecB
MIGNPIMKEISLDNPGKPKLHQKLEISNVNTRHNETKEDKQMKILHRTLKANEQHLTKT